MNQLVLDIPALLHLDTFAGRRSYRITVIGETREFFRFRAETGIPMPGGRPLSAGARGRAPKSAVTPITPAPPS